jgi:hypothetical protein
MTVVNCDHHRCWRDGKCSKSCESTVQNAFPAPVATMVAP